jgi:molybdate transport system substrate-binding protein
MPTSESVRGAPIAGISSIATRYVLADLGMAFERQSGQGVSVEAVGGVDAARRVESAEPFDFVVLAAEAIERLARSGHVDPDSRVALARSGIAIAVAAGAARPDIGDESAVRTAVLRARTIGFSTGPSGVHLTHLLERWGIAETVTTRLVQAPPGVPVGTLIARGEVELGFQQLSELMHVQGIDVLGSLPPEIQSVTTFTCAICTASARTNETRALLSFFASPQAADAKRRHGMEPA